MEISTIAALINESQSQVKGLLIERFSKNKSLSEVGKELNITKERVRQIEGRVLAKLTSEACIKEVVGVLSNIIKKDIVISTEKIKTLFKSELEADILIFLIKNKMVENFYLEREAGLIYFLSGQGLEATTHAIKEIMANGELPFINNKTKIQDIEFDQQKLDTLIRLGVIIKISEKQYIENPNTKRKALELWLAIIGESGFPIKKQLTAAKKQLAKLFPSLFAGKENIGALIENNHNIILKDWGLYVHIGHINTAIKKWPKEKFEEAALFAIENEGVYNIEDFFIKNEEELNAIGITSMHMLYEIARKSVSKDKMSFKHTPWVSAPQAEKKKVADVANDYAKKVKTPFAVSDLAKHLGVKPTRAMQIIAASKELTRVGKNSYQIIQ